MEPAPFTTDGCSGFLSFLWHWFRGVPPPWEGCCTRHDRMYWRGGDLRLRLQVDTELMRCVAGNGHPWWALLMFVAVRIGGVYWLPFPSLRRVNGRWRFFFNGVRWGYSLPWPNYKQEQ